jgi:hypothetical protein
MGLVVLLWLVNDLAQAQYTGDLKGQPYPYRDVFPLGGKRLAKRGVAFPRPWGVGLNYMFMQQPIDITSIALGVNDSGMTDVSKFIKFKSVDSQVQAVNLRVDLWLFPFLNIYALGNYSPASKTDVVLAEPIVLNAGTKQWVAGSGFGATAALGAFGFWATFDANWTWNHAEKLDQSVRTTMFTPRVGRAFGKWGKIGLNLWAGTMGQIITAQTSGAIRLDEAIGSPSDQFKDDVKNWYDGLPPAQQAVVGKVVTAIQSAELGKTKVRYDLDKKVAHQWNMLLGAQLELSDAWFLRAEVGFIHRESVLLGFNYRFATPGLH